MTSSWEFQQLRGPQQCSGCREISLVAHTGFEPVISALRGRCPWPLDECATQGRLLWLGIEDSNLGLQIQSLSSYR